MADTPELAEARAGLLAAATSGNASALARMYTSDAVLMNPNAPDVRGRAEIEAHFRRAFGLIAIREMTLTPIEIAEKDPDAWELSTFTQMIARPGQPSAEDRGRVLLVWRRDADTNWRIRYALVNSSLAQSPLH
jgi:uncharacterized protein (TIGR02246 family)